MLIVSKAQFRRMMKKRKFTQDYADEIYELLDPILRMTGDWEQVDEEEFLKHMDGKPFEANVEYKTKYYTVIMSDKNDSIIYKRYVPTPPNQPVKRWCHYFIYSLKFRSDMSPLKLDSITTGTHKLVKYTSSQKRINDYERTDR